MDHSSVSPHAIIEAPPPKQDVDDFLRRKRKVREHKACYPCRQRKVRCDLGRPCKTCVEREHPELCDYHPPAKRQHVGLPSVAGPAHDDRGTPYPAGPGSITISHADFAHLCRKLESVESTIEDLRRELRSNNANASYKTSNLSGPPTPIVNGRPCPDGSRSDLPINSAALPAFHTRNDLTGQTVHLGGSSVPALVMALGQGGREQPELQDVLGKSILPLFGLDNETATYPFVDLWGLAHGWMAKAEQLAKTIPADSQCLNFFHYYRDLGHVIYAGVADISGFEQDLTSFLMTRASYGEMERRQGDNLPPGVTEQSLFDKDLNWIGLLFAVLASGCQCSNLPRKERELTSQVYVCCSFECLRFTNFLSVPTLESVQALLVLGNVISNNMNAGTSWNLIGLTARLAQSLGLHQDCPTDMPITMKALRNKIWWTLMWQDSLLSITYDRASFSALVDHSPMADPRNHINISPFHSSILRISKVALDVVRDRSKAMSNRELFSRIQRSRDEINTVLRECAEHLRDSRRCRSLRESIEHWSLYLHVSYILSELCRPAISPSSSDPELTRSFRQTCLDSLINTVEAWLGLQNITSYARQSWASVHRALSSALLLGIMREHAHNDRCRRLLGRFIGLMGDMTSGVNPAELAAPMTRAIEALRKLRIHETPVEGHATPAQPPVTKNNGAYHAGHPGYPQTHQHQLYPPTANQTNHPPRFIEDIALGSGPSPRTDTSSPSVRHGEMGGPGSWPGSAASRVASAHGSGDEQSPYSVLNSILWGNGRVPGAIG
ncbi:hypothetical protein CAC42_297 [Sphaceloma murrayae]|uniref:Zn(2)-C6 fungal-type domain-containing protein n=1 Tax=Sphaceloma murrayae TaxID=2082308 RepID=A0A2K1R013_9PEZI|nr:hypothetical protein CAC42_297 [Sphaceloma murrayae]